MNQKQVMSRYGKELAFASIAYAALLVASIITLQRYELSKTVQVIITLLPAIPTAFVIIAIMRMLISSDELQQRIQLYATAFSAALTGFITFSYGFLENVGFPKFSTFLIFPMLVAFWGISLGYFSRKYQ
jgi:chromate transport protein ChrA